MGDAPNRGALLLLAACACALATVPVSGATATEVADMAALKVALADAAVVEVLLTSHIDDTDALAVSRTLTIAGHSGGCGSGAGAYEKCRLGASLTVDGGGGAAEVTVGRCALRVTGRTFSTFGKPSRRMLVLKS
jgi:hypothetical protein